MPTVVPSPPFADALPLLREVPLFAQLHDSMLLTLSHELDWVRLHGGELLFERGEIGDCFYVLLNGRVELFVQDRVLGVVGKGELVGELAMLSEEGRPASARATRDSLLVRLSRSTFQKLLAHDARTVMTLSRTVAEQLHEAHSTIDAPRHAATMVTYALQPSVALEEASRKLAEALGRYRTLVLVDRRLVQESLGEGIADAPPHSPADDRFSAWLHRLEEECELVLFVADPTSTEWTRRCLRQAETIVAFADAAKTADASALETLSADHEQKRGRTRRELVLMHDDSHRVGFGTAGWQKLIAPDGHHHVHADSEAHFARMARHLTGSTVTLVLGGGGARGFAHIGVYRALTEAGIVLDAIAGSSMGSAMGGMIALGWDPQTVQERTREIFVGPKSVYDVTVPSWSLIAGQRLANSVKKAFGEHTHIEDLWLRYFCVTSNLTRAEVEVHDSGPLWHWVRASGSIPGIAPPVPRNGDLLVDGGVLNNLPADIARQRHTGRIIAVNVLRNVDGTTTGAVPGELKPLQVLWRRFHPRTPDRNIPTLDEVLMRTAMLGIAANTARVRRDVDLFLEPPVDAFSIFDAKPLSRIAEIGYRYTLEQLRDWKT
jgi:predicted acylesterase/phospholipase RssA/CRP-like cAMP-binding protein